MSYRRLWRYGNYLLWALAGVCFVAILVCNALPVETYPPFLSPLLSYGTLFLTGGAMLCQTLRRKRENNSDTSYYLKLMGSALFLVTVAVYFVNDIVM